MENSSGLPSVGQLLKQSWELFKTRVKTLLLVSVIGVAVIVVISLIFGGGMAFFGSNMDAQGVPEGMSLVTMIIMIVIVMLVAFLEQGALVSAVSSPADNGVGAAYRAAWNKFGPFLWTSILGGIIIAIGFVLLIVPGVIIAVWFSVAGFIVMNEGKNGWSALAASKAYVAGRWGKVFVYLLVLVVIGVLLSIVAGFLGQFGNLIVQLLVMPWTVAYSYGIYQPCALIRKQLRLPLQRRLLRQCKYNF
jgi:hypothetical protein